MEIEVANVSMNGQVVGHVALSDEGQKLLSDTVIFSSPKSREQFGRRAAQAFEKNEHRAGREVDAKYLSGFPKQVDRMLLAKLKELQQEILEPAVAPVLISLATVAPQSVRWLWGQKFARGKVSVLYGDPGGGKTLLSTDLVARVTTGSPWPDGLENDGPGGVIFLTAEDDLADTIVPRLIAAGADLNRVNVLKAIRAPGEDGTTMERSFTLADIPQLKYAIHKTPDCRLIVIDPVSAYLGRVDSHVNADVRAALSPLQELAAEFNVAIILITHMSKGGGGNALYRATGSLAFVAAARSAWLVVKDKNDPRRRLFLPAKNNIGKDGTGLAYTIIEKNGAPVICWEREPITMGADEALADDHRSKPGPEAEELEAALEWLRPLLANGPVEVNKIKEYAKAAGMAWRTVHRAKDRLKVRAYPSQFGGAWMWKLTEAQAPVETSPSGPEPPFWD